MSLGGTDGGISIPRRQPLSPVFRRAGRHHRSARTALPHACLRRETGTAQGVFHRHGPRSCDRGGRLDANESCALVPSGTSSRAAMGSTAVRRRGSPPHATPLDRERLATPSLVGRGGCSSPTSATYLSTRAPACIARLPRWPPLAQLPRPMGRTPAGDSSHGALDGAPRASTDAYSALATRRGRTPQNPGGLPIGKSPRRVSFHPRRFPPRMKRAHRPLTPRFTTCSPPSRRRALRTPPGPPSPPPRQGRCFRRPEAPSIDECPLGPPPLSER